MAPVEKALAEARERVTILEKMREEDQLTCLVGALEILLSKMPYEERRTLPIQLLTKRLTKVTPESRGEIVSLWRRPAFEKYSNIVSLLRSFDLELQRRIVASFTFDAS